METNINSKYIFPKGLPGFEQEKEFCLVLEEEQEVLAQLNSTNNQDISFVLVRPQLFFTDYLAQLELSLEEADLLEALPTDQLEIWAIITLSLSQLNKSTVNLRAPLALNKRTKKGMQIILNDEIYSARQHLLADSERTAETITPTIVAEKKEEHLGNDIEDIKEGADSSC